MVGWRLATCKVAQGSFKVVPEVDLGGTRYQSSLDVMPSEVDLGGSDCGNLHDKLFDS